MQKGRSLVDEAQQSQGEGIPDVIILYNIQLISHGFSSTDAGHVAK